MTRDTHPLIESLADNGITGTSNLFPLELLQAVSDWQRGGDVNQNKKRGQKLKEVCTLLPEKYRTCLLCCFRQVALPKGGVWKLIGGNRLPEKISSWTLDVEVAKRFKGGVPPEGQEYQGVILCVCPSPGSVIVNLRELYKDPDFTAEMEKNKAAIVGYENGSGLYANDQSEVVLEVASVTQQDIYSMGGHSSPFEKLVAEAAKHFYGPNATPDQCAELLLKAEPTRSEAGPKWLNSEATKRVLDNIKPKAEVLVEIKRNQAAS
jgi:hypothetical protein